MILAKKDCEGYDYKTKVCDWKEPQTTDTAVWEKHIIKPLVIKDCCGCPVSGFVKYNKNGHTAYLVDYGDGVCDQ